MYFLKSLLSPRSRTAQEDRVQAIFAGTRLNGCGILHPDYLRIFTQELAKADDESKCLKMVISNLQSLTTLQEIVKLFTIIHQLLVQRNYQGNILACIENAEIIIDRDLQLENKQYEGWFIPFYRTYIYYLVKITSNSQIFIRAKQEIPAIQPKMYLGDFFRLLNQMNILLLPLNNTIKIVGRYYGKKLKVFDEFYRVLQKELITIYKYLHTLIKSILKNYQQMSVGELEAFIRATPEYEIMIDQLEELLMCKYFHIGCKESQPYIFAEDIAKINYHIQCNKKADFTPTSPKK